MEEKLKIGDLVRVKDTGRICFVEDIISDCRPNWPQRVSLYTVDGRYIGDHTVDELQTENGKIPADSLQELIKRSVLTDQWGLVRDYAKVYVLVFPCGTWCAKPTTVNE